MTGDRRADYVSIDPDTGRINLWENRCSEIDDGDDGDNGGSDGGDDGGDDDKPWKARSKHEWCDLAEKQGFVPAQQSYIWGSSGNGLGVGQWLDEWLSARKEGEEKWVNALRMEYQDAIDDTKFDSLVCNNIRSNAHCDFTDLPSCGKWHYFLTIS